MTAGVVHSIARQLRDARLRLTRRKQRILFSFTGGSGASKGMGRELDRSEPSFREAIEHASAVVHEVLGWSPLSFFRGGDAAPESEEVARRNEIIVLGIVQIAQVDLWRAAGFVPAGVVSVSLGEMVAPYAAGSIDREGCARVLASVSHAISRTRTSERMFLLDLDSMEAQRLCRLAPMRLEWLGATTPHSAAVLGSERDAPAIRSFFGDAVSRELPTDWPYHTPRLDVDRAFIVGALRNVESRPAACPVYSSTVGGMLPPSTRFDAQFFSWMVSRPFRYDDAVTRALRDRYDTVINIGATPATAASLAETARAAGTPVVQLDTMRPDDEQGTWKRAVRDVRRRGRSVAGDPRPRADARSVDFTDSTAGAFLFETYEELRANGSVQFLARHGSWIVLGYDEVEHVLAHPESYSSDLPQMREMDPVLFAADPPSHTAMRRTLGRQFTPQHISSHARAAEELAGGLLASLAAVEEFDVVADFAEPLAEHAGARILGIDAGRVASLREAFTASRGDNLQLYRLLATPFQPLAPETTLFGELVEAGLDEAAARSLVRAMWAASTGELRRVIPQVVLAMLENAEARRRVTEDASLLGAFLDETLRLRPPEHVILRRTTHELELGGARIPANATLRLSIAAANRDPRHFADPSAFRLDRSGSGHLAFGGGAHRCLGAALARAVTIATVGSLLRAAPRFKARQPLSTIRHAPGAPLASVEQLVIVHE